MNLPTKRMLFSVLATLLLLTACGPAPVATQDPALVQKVIEQSVALTVAAQNVQAQNKQLIDQAVAMTVTAQNAETSRQQVSVAVQEPVTPAPTSTGILPDTISTSTTASLVSPPEGTLDPNPPVVLSVSPNTGFTTGDVRVVITGKNFIPGQGYTHFYFGDAEATFVVCKSTTQCTAIAPNIDTGMSVTVTAKNLGQKPQTNATSDTFTYVVPDPDAPVINSVSPNRGPIAGGTFVTITGRNFQVGDQTNTQFYFGDNQATEVLCESNEKCTAKSPAGTEGIVTVEAVILTEEGIELTSKHIDGNRGDSFRYNAPPKYGCGIMTVTPDTKNLITMGPGNSFTIKFIVKNTGELTWPAGTDVKYSGGENMGEISIKEINKIMKPGDTFAFGFEGKAPTNPGIHYMTWIVEGQGCQGYVAINVD